MSLKFLPILPPGAAHRQHPNDRSAARPCVLASRRCKRWSVSRAAHEDAHLMNGVPKSMSRH
jgi:hypothetical protein